MLKPISELSEDARQIIAHLNTTMVDLHRRRGDQIGRVCNILKKELQEISTKLDTMKNKRDSTVLLLITDQNGKVWNVQHMVCFEVKWDGEKHSLRAELTTDGRLSTPLISKRLLRRYFDILAEPSLTKSKLLMSRRLSAKFGRSDLPSLSEEQKRPIIHFYQK